MKLELKHLAPYLPYGLKILSKYKNDVEGIVYLMGIENIETIITHDSRKPILRPLSDLTIEFKDDFRFTERAITIHKYGLNHWLKGLRFDIVEFLFENHFDVFGLIEKGLAIDINTL